MKPKSAFDRVDRKILWKAMERREIRRGKERIKEIYENNKHVVRDNGRVSEGFWTEKGLRQSCPLSLILAVNSKYKRRNKKGTSRGSTSRWR